MLSMLSFHYSLKAVIHHAKFVRIIAMLIFYEVLAIIVPHGIFGRTSQESSGVPEYCQDESFSASCLPPPPAAGGSGGGGGGVGVGGTQVILMESARYGRLRLGRCVKRNLGYLGCAVDALRYLDSRCSGHVTCDVSVMDAALREMQPCPKDVTWHLEASFRCVDVVVGSSHECHTKHYSSSSAQSGYLSSAVASRTSIGSSVCPWRIVVQPGQTINITLMNFVSMSHISPSSSSSSLSSSSSSFSASGGTGGGGTGGRTDGGGSDAGVGGGRINPLGKPSSTELCYDVALVRDGPTTRSVTACSSEPRTRTILVSANHVVEIEFTLRRAGMTSSHVLTTSPGNSVQFIIHYQAVGCPNLSSQTGSGYMMGSGTGVGSGTGSGSGITWTGLGAGIHVTRDRDTLTLRCNSTGETWYQTCVGTKWIGPVGNCSSSPTGIQSNHVWTSGDDFFTGNQPGSFPLGILIVVAVGVALGVFLGGTMLLLASMLMKRRQRRRLSRQLVAQRDQFDQRGVGSGGTVLMGGVACDDVIKSAYDVSSPYDEQRQREEGEGEGLKYYRTCGGGGVEGGMGWGMGGGGRELTSSRESPMTMTTLTYGGVDYDYEDDVTRRGDGVGEGGGCEGVGGGTCGGRHGTTGAQGFHLPPYSSTPRIHYHVYESPQMTS